MPSLQHAPSQSRCRKLRPMVIVRMSSWTRLWLALCAIVFAHSGLGQTYQGRELVKATLLADTSAIIPGKPFTAGMLLRMAPGWHTYWKFSGDAGLPTETKWKLPARETPTSSRAIGVCFRKNFPIHKLQLQVGAVPVPIFTSGWQATIWRIIRRSIFILCRKATLWLDIRAPNRARRTKLLFEFQSNRRIRICRPCRV